MLNPFGVEIRNQIISPIHDGLEKAGAIFGAAGGYERPLWYHANHSNGRVVDDNERLNIDGDRDYFEHVARECRACRENSVLFDLSSFSKFVLEGPDAASFLQLICSADIDRGLGRTVYTLILNDAGGIETALVVTKVEKDKFLLTGGSGERSKIMHWLSIHLDQLNMDQGDKVLLKDVTEQQALIAVTGPTSKMLLQQVADPDTVSVLPFGKGQWLEVAGTSVWVQRLSYAGELGYEIYVDAADGKKIHGAIVHAAQQYDSTQKSKDMIGLKHAGSVAQNILRLEKVSPYGTIVL